MRKNKKEASTAQIAARAKNFDIFRLEGMLSSLDVIRKSSHVDTAGCKMYLDQATVGLIRALACLRGER